MREQSTVCVLLSQGRNFFKWRELGSQAMDFRETKVKLNYSTVSAFSQILVYLKNKQLEIFL